MIIIPGSMLCKRHEVSLATGTLTTMDMCTVGLLTVKHVHRNRCAQMRVQCTTGVLENSSGTTGAPKSSAYQKCFISKSNSTQNYLTSSFQLNFNLTQLKVSPHLWFTPIGHVDKGILMIWACVVPGINYM